MSQETIKKILAIKESYLKENDVTASNVQRGTGFLVKNWKKANIPLWNNATLVGYKEVRIVVIDTTTHHVCDFYPGTQEAITYYVTNKDDHLYYTNKPSDYKIIVYEPQKGLDDSDMTVYSPICRNGNQYFVNAKEFSK